MLHYGGNTWYAIVYDMMKIKLGLFYFWWWIDVEKRYKVSFAKESENRASMKGPVHGIHSKANGGGQGLKTVLREVECKTAESTARVFVWNY